jgi:PKD repeat protein
MPGISTMLLRPWHVVTRVLCRKRSRGQSAVEFALVLPVFMLLLLIAVDFGRLFFTNIEVNNAAREGASYAATNPTDATGIQAHLVQETNAQAQRGAGTISAPTVICKDPTNANVVIACSTATGGAGQGYTVTVSATEPFTFFTPLINGFFNNNLNIGASATAVVLGYAASTGATPPPGTCPMPTASFTVVVDNTRTIVTNPSASTPNSGIYSISGFNWAWGDSSKDVGTASATSHTYGADGTYTVTLETTNQCGTATATESVTVPMVEITCTNPTALFSAVVVGYTVTFTDHSTVTDSVNCPITAWAWNFGDGTGQNADTLSNRQNPSFTYSNSGQHTVTLVVTNSAGASAPVSHKQ